MLAYKLNHSSMVHFNHRALVRAQHAGTLHVCMHAASCSILIFDKSRKKKSFEHAVDTLYSWPRGMMCQTKYIRYK